MEKFSFRTPEAANASQQLDDSKMNFHSMKLHSKQGASSFFGKPDTPSYKTSLRDRQSQADNPSVESRKVLFTKPFVLKDENTPYLGNLPLNSCDNEHHE